MARRNRKLNPPTRRDYRYYEPFLREELDYACSYCEIWENQNGGRNNFQVDHYLPKEHFSNHIFHYPNLNYSCAFCNRVKSNFWADDTDEMEYVLNPFRHDFEEHIDSSDIWLGISDAGRFHVRLFSLNLSYHRRMQSERKSWVRKKIACEEIIAELEELERELIEIGHLNNAAKVQEQIRDHRQSLEEYDLFLSRVLDRRDAEKR